MIIVTWCHIAWTIKGFEGVKNFKSPIVEIDDMR